MCLFEDYFMMGEKKMKKKNYHNYLLHVFLTKDSITIEVLYIYM